MTLQGKTILVTGGTGSFGQKFAKIVLEKYDPKAIRIYSRSEFLQSEMQQKYDDSRLRFFIGDIRDEMRLSRAMNGADIVVHAAALKQVPTAEYNPSEVIKTNVMGTANVVEAAIDNGVEKVLLVSTDKSVNPVNLYGATKLCAERLFTQANAYVGGRNTRLACVRYGNVVGSRGSVIPAFLQQKERGMLAITDERMTRFWITLEQGVEFVVSSIENMDGGEIFVPKIPSMRLVDMADVVAPGIPRKKIGMRPGEKLHEILLTEYEAMHSRDMGSFYIIDPEFVFWSRKQTFQSGIKLSPDFSYTSDKNTWWLTKEELAEILKDMNG